MTDEVVILGQWICECGAEMTASHCQERPIEIFQHGKNPEHILEATLDEILADRDLQGFLAAWLERLHNYETAVYTQEVIP